MEKYNEFLNTQNVSPGTPAATSCPASATDKARGPSGNREGGTESEAEERYAGNDSHLWCGTDGRRRYLYADTARTIVWAEEVVFLVLVVGNLTDLPQDR